MSDFLIKYQDICSMETSCNKSINSLQAHLDTCDTLIEQFCGNREFTGKAADSIKNYMRDTHLTLIDSLRVTADQLLTEMKRYKKKYAAIDSSSTFVLSEEGMQNCRDLLKSALYQMEDSADIVNQQIYNISDIISLKCPSRSKIESVHEKTDQYIENLREQVQELESATMQRLEYLSQMESSLRTCISKLEETGNSITHYTSGSYTSDTDVEALKHLCDNVISDFSYCSWYERLKAVIDEADEGKDFLSTVKTVLGAADSLGGDKKAGVLKSTISYFESLVSFYSGDMEGLSGASDWCSLAGSSISVWSKAYNYFSNMYKKLDTGLFSKAMQEKVSVAGLAGSCINYIGSVMSASEDLSEKSLATKIADYVETGKSLVSAIKSGYTLHSLKYIKDADNLGKIKAGVWSALSVYSSVAEGTVASISQAIRSYDKYSEDGDWSLEDTGSTGLEVSLAGIYSICDSLTWGLADVVFYLASGGEGQADMSYFEQAAEGYKIIAEDIGQKIGESVLGWKILINKIKTAW